MIRRTPQLTTAALSDLVATVHRIRSEIDDQPPVLIGAGISTLAYGFSSPHGPWVLRVSRSHPDPWTWRGGRVHEVGLMAELRQRGICVPADATVIVAAEGCPVAILERQVVGVPLTRELARDDPNVPTQIARVLDRLHGFDVADVVTRGVPVDDGATEFRDALGLVRLDAGLRRRVEAALAVLEARETIRTLCHRDFRSEHLIFDDGGELVGLLDLGEIGVDDPAVDLAFLHGELDADVLVEVAAAMETADAGLLPAARTLHSLWPLLELASGGETWGDPATARQRLDALV